MPLLLERGAPQLPELEEDEFCDHEWVRAPGDYRNSLGEPVRVYDCNCGATRAEKIPKPPPLWLRYQGR